ncbi:nitrate reductase cytochrome c-type subunit [Thalassospira lucentensis]|uniref:Periplasmic nitrate reductase, electron transfer subunit n=1 Tax=Thalassospira lucentensis TaxID=168935 RepID=A0A358HQ90_9PROT|nr:nitrate reductase cytochrome c-type subunit [Thalassospira lucentensis]RCK30465.1 nitrate reductase [Thalassospira lucentensis MCCC 1A00383 = DSM 14000]HBU97356.1 nitrate reductase cytochrome c-type subunit; periplasmic nitrate reductase electron transfer subunit [Thalassospira lucentensis]HCW67665.1 nitrate reductase cytochrome c-type subunit; periplasmic nitrate reductase electron transfer subunit [Thalassospira lucentensis]|tara:strand:+ start:97 stop:561 length:465 start_codon:yes stop_codon:yes gene_type:complete
MKISPKWLLSLAIIGIAGMAYAAEPITTLRSTAPDQESAAPRITNFEDNSVKRPRNYPEQPPTIPHDIEGYQIDRNANKCLSCHARSRTGESGAPMVSITHFMDRDNQFLAAVSPRRYFCTQCHVPQKEVKPLVDNDFVDIDQLLPDNGTRIAE